MTIKQQIEELKSKIDRLEKILSEQQEIKSKYILDLEIALFGKEHKVYKKAYEILIKWYVEAFAYLFRDDTTIDDFVIEDEHIFYSDIYLSYDEIRYSVDNKLNSQRLIDYNNWYVDNYEIYVSIPNFKSWLKMNGDYSMLKIKER